MGYYDQSLSWWDGEKWRPTDAEWQVGLLSKESTTSIATSTSLTLNGTAGNVTINRGATVDLAATVAGTTAGTVEFRAGSTSGTLITSDTASPWNSANYAPTATTTVYAVYKGSGVYLPSNSVGRTITVKQKATKTAAGPAKSSSNWEWKQSSEPYQIASTLTVGSGKDIPYATAYITAVTFWLSGYNGTSTCRAGVWNNGSPATLLGSSPNTTTASGGDTAGEVKQTKFTFSSPITVTTGTYNIGFWRSTSAGTAWSKSGTASGRTIWEDNSASSMGQLDKDASEGSLSLSWTIDYYIWQ